MDKYNPWLRDWLECYPNWSSPRLYLACQLRYVRKADGNQAARIFLACVRRIKRYPAKKGA
jgi:hypothetical protein